MGVGINIAKKVFQFKYPRFKAITADDDKGVARLNESVVRFTESGSWLLFKNIDLTSINSVFFEVDPGQIGGRLSLHLDRPGGEEISSVLINQVKRVEKKGADQNNRVWQTVSSKLTSQAGAHDVYLVYNDPPNAASGMWITLFLRDIEFSNKQTQIPKK